jgi:ectoine hydroxylase-related dioxygenase (phytanoyl-CoA dioxygenase family)
MDSYLPLVTEVHAEKGDAIIFCEAIIHGALPWRGEHERRMVLYRFNPGHAAYTPGLATFDYPEWFFDLTEEQRAVLQQPASRGRKDIMGSEQMRGAAKL